MPGSTATSSSEQTKAKVTDSSATNGVFVRPVAVAGIFRPAEESSNKPPTLPEKRRFSALSGDLRPCSGVTNDDFARRRQSWDTKVKEVPFGQALLRKTPKNTSTSSVPGKQESATNGSSHEDNSRNDASTSQISEKSLEKINSESASCTQVSTTILDTQSSVKDVSVPKKDVPEKLHADVPKKEKTQIESRTIKEESKSISQSDTKVQKIVSKELSSETKIVSDSISFNSASKVSTSVSEKSISKNFVPNATVVDKSANSADCSKQPKKVYGLIKRDTKPETVVTKSENTVIKRDSKPEVDSSKTEKALLNKEAQPEISLKVDSLPEKVESSKIKKVYGLSKTSVRKDSEIAQNKSTEASIITKTPESNSVNKSPESNKINKPQEANINNKSINASETKPINKPSETKPINKPSETNITDKQVVPSVIKNTTEGSSLSSKESTVSKSSECRPASGPPKPVGKFSEFQKAQSPPKDFRTVRRTSDVIAARIQNIFSNISAPEKPLPSISRKTKVLEKADTGADSVLNKSSSAEKLSSIQITKSDNENQVFSSSKNETMLTVESKSEAKKSVSAKCPVAAPEVKTSLKRIDGNVNKEESKYKQQSQTSADHSSLKKENKLTSGSSNVLQSCKTGEAVNTSEVKTEFPLKKADSKAEHSINAASSKAEDKKILNIGGRMPIKKQDQNSVESTTSLKTTNEDDRKSSDSTVPQRIVVETANKGQILKTETSNTCGSSVEKISKSISASYTVNTGFSKSSDVKTTQNISKKTETNDSIKETSSCNSNFVSQTVVKASSARQSSSVNTCSSEISQPQIKKLGRLSIENGNVESSQIAKIEVAKITPSTVPSTVPTINVLFRTKSPQSSATKEENRKKVVVETFTSTSPVPSVINASKVSENLTVQSSSSTNVAVKDALKTVESIKKSIDSPSLSKKHTVKNLKKEEQASGALATTVSSDVDAKMPPNTVKVSDKCPPVSDGTKIETNEKPKEKIVTSDSVKLQSDKNSFQTTSKSESDKRPESQVSITAETSQMNSGIKTETKEQNKTDNITLRSNSMENTDLEMGKRFESETKLNVVDLGDWSKKFQRNEPEPPRVPLRRRAVRDSLPPSLPLRSRFGSLKRIEDSPRYLPRSPSQSSLPLRYSYTEMLSKVCSMGVLPTVEPSMSKSCSSSSSQVSELWSELSEEQSTATHTSEMLEAETTERMRLEKEVQELQNRCSQVQLRSDKMEMEMMEARVYRTPELNGDLSEDEDPEGNSSLYKQKYERAIRDMEIMKRRIQQQHEEEMEQKDMLKKVSDKRLAEALEDVEEERQVANQWKRKAQKLGSEMQDLRLMLEEQMARNGELEKKQRRFDAELSAAQEEIKKERLLREKFAREKDQAMHEKYSLEQDLQSARLDVDTLHEKITQLNRELDELTLSSKGEEEVTQLKRAKQELERKCRDQEEELEELAAQVSMLEQAKLRLEMSLEKVRQEHRREASVREEEIEEIRASFSKKIKNLEAQLESEQDERHQLMKQKHELERRLYEIADQPPPQDPEIERRLRRDLKRTKALLRDAQSMLEHTREGQSGKTLIRQLKNQLEDSEFAKAAAVKARQAVEAELQECQIQLEEATRAKNEAESRCLQLSREKSAIQTQLEETEEEMAEVMKKYKAVVAQMSIDQKTLSEQNQQIADLETEKQMLKDQLSEVSHKFEHLAGQSEDTHKVHRLDGKVRDLESKLELELTTRSRLEHQIARLKEQNDRVREECDSLRNKELQAQEGVRRLQRQMRELREDYSSLQQKEAEAYRKQHELEMALENTETDLQVTKNDLRLACQRIQDLQNALEDDLDSGTDVPDDSGSDSDESFELAMLRNQSVTPTQRCGSAASNYSLASEGFRSRTSSFTNELSAFSSRNDAEKDINGFSGVSTSSRLFDVENDETV